LIVDHRNTTHPEDGANSLKWPPTPDSPSVRVYSTLAGLPIEPCAQMQP